MNWKSRTPRCSTGHTWSHCAARWAELQLPMGPPWGRPIGSGAVTEQGWEHGESRCWEQIRKPSVTLSSLLNSRERKRKTESSSIHGIAERGRKIKSSAQQTSYIAALLNQLFPPQSCSRISEFTRIDNQHLKITTSEKARGLYTSRVLPVLGIRPILKNAATLHLFA